MVVNIRDTVRQIINVGSEQKYGVAMLQNVMRATEGVRHVAYKK